MIEGKPGTAEKVHATQMANHYLFQPLSQKTPAAESHIMCFSFANIKTGTILISMENPRIDLLLPPA